MKKLLRAGPLFVFASLMLAAFAFGAHTNFKATLTGAQEVPAVTTNATGTAVMTLTPAGLVYLITANGLSGTITGAHFHLGAAGTNGPVLIDLTSSFGGRTTATGTLTLPDSVVAAFLTGRIYLNLHTAANPNGEIRGQVIQHSGTAFQATLEGAQEVPAVTTTARGAAAITLSSVGGVGLHYRVTVNGLSGPIMSAHFHRGFAGENGPIVREITNEFRDNTATGVWRTGTAAGSLPDSIIAAFLTGRIYINVHTAANTGGEIRGQVNLSAGFGLTAKLDGGQEVPPVTTTARGTASLTLAEYGMVYNITVDGLSGPIMGAHFHKGVAGSNGPVVFTLANTNHQTGIWRFGTAAGSLTTALLQAFLADSIYINFHTAANPNGEIRGQVNLKAGSGASARLDALQEVPRVTNNAKGTATLTATPTGVNYDITVNGLSGAIMGAHFHRGGIGVAGPIVKTITTNFTGNTAIGTWGTADATDPFTEELRAALVAGQLYLNVHTMANPAGELRGQVLIDAGAGFRADLTTQQEVPPTPKPSLASGTGAFTLTRGGLGFNISTSNLSGPIMAAHFHLEDIGKAGGIVFTIPTANISGPNLTGYWRTAPAGNLVDSLIVALLAGRLYVNIHTADNPSGELRGQVNIGEGTGLVANLTGAQEVPPVTTNARGAAAVTVNDAGITFNATVTGLSGPIQAAHFHNAAPGVNGPVVRTITGAFRNNTAAGLWRSNDTEALSNALLRQAFLGNLYLNIHTAANLNGEIRGQVRSGASILTSVASRETQTPSAFSLAQNYPNPFNPETEIRYELPQNVRVKLVIYDLLGARVRTLVDAFEAAGPKQVKWDGANDAGKRVASGIYLYRLEAGNFKSVRKLTLMK